MRRDGGSVFPAHANTGDPNGPIRGLSANELARALISMMARSTTRSNQRPDTLMQDRTSARSAKPLATHGRTIHWVTTGKVLIQHKISALPPKADVRSGSLASLRSAGGFVIQASDLEAGIMRYELSDEEWATIRPMLPNKPRGVPRVDDRRVPERHFLVLRSGAYRTASGHTPPTRLKLVSGVGSRIVGDRHFSGRPGFRINGGCGNCWRGRCVA